eukprot:m.297010 g.297010  ORF g.297010 m.297010 type:complete len:840 (+) comp16395_c3_seq14:154-2673(+)
MAHIQNFKQLHVLFLVVITLLSTFPCHGIQFNNQSGNPDSCSSLFEGEPQVCGVCLCFPGICIDCSNTQLNKFPPDEKQLPTSSYLDLDIIALFLGGNFLEKLDRDMFKHFTSVQWMALADNNITTVAEDTFAANSNLTVLILNGNLLLEVPESLFANNPYASLVGLPYNNLCTIPTNFFKGLSMLTEIGLNNNMITSLENVVFDAKSSLVGFSVVYNYLKKFPIQFTRNVASLTMFNIADNYITEIPPFAFQGAKNLTFISFLNNKLTKIPDSAFIDLTKLHNLILSGNAFQIVSAGLFNGLDNLKKLSLSECNIFALEPGLLEHVPNLEVLSFLNNSLTTLPLGFFEGSKKIVGVGFGGNNLLELPPEIFSPLTKLEFIDLTHNQLTVIPSFASNNLSNAFFDDNEFRNATQVQIAVNVMLESYTVATIPYITVSNNPVFCVFDTNTFSKFECACSKPYIHTGSVCSLPDMHETWEIIVGSVSGIVGGMIIALLIMYVAREFKTLKEEVGLHERLLVDKTTELSELVRGWDIASEDVTLLHRIDVGKEGTSGEVWKGNWDGLIVAVKRLRSALFEMDPLVIKDFEEEVHFLRKCRHRNMVRFFGAGTDAESGIPFLVMEHVELGSLQSYLEDNTNIPWDRKLHFASDIQSGMEFLHNSLERLHRDLKTANILLSNRMRCKVADFGTVKTLIEKSTKKTNVTRFMTNTNDQTSRKHTQGVGTPVYMAPEVIRGQQCGPPADVWSFGVVLWEIAKQELPYLDNFIAQDATDIPWQKAPFLQCQLEALSRGLRLPLNESECPSGYAALTSECMVLAPTARPSFSDIGESLEKIQDELAKE